ncbi:hypothetical protein [Aeromonas sp. SCS5]|uniref:hypothetical protein n=1 Tax=Aeromonas sp. SCS5 TaxID=1519205 RepID=UPI000903EA7B|nr:hypothetical protein [Aeromonas sp. SCS5]
MSSLEDIANGRKRQKKEKTKEQRELEKQQNRARVAKSRAKAAAQAAQFVPGEACSVLIKLDASDSKALGEGMRWRALWSAKAYDLSEYVQMLIIRDKQALAEQLERIPPCRKCGARLPDSCNRLHYGEEACVLTYFGKGLAL